MSLRAVVALLRPFQWVKNGLCLAGVFFSGKLHQPGMPLRALAVAATFCAASSAIYALNDALDHERDRLHPTKRRRPVAAGEVSRGLAIALALALGIAAFAGAWALGPPALACVALYALNGAAYTAWLKHHMVVDVASIATGFVLRLVAGVFVLDELPTAWITVCTLFLALSLALGKRRGELAAAGAAEARPVLRSYTLPYLDQLLASTTVAATIAYGVFTTSSGKNHTLVVTLPLVWCALARYLWLVTTRAEGEEPERLVFRDRPLLACTAVWVVVYYVVDYHQLQLFR